jgi:hypothetical protein
VNAKIDYVLWCSRSAFRTHALRSSLVRPGGKDITPLSTAATMRGRSKLKVWLRS